MSRRSYVNDTRLYDDNNNNTTTINNNSNIMLDTCTDFHMCDGDMTTIITLDFSAVMWLYRRQSE